MNEQQLAAVKLALEAFRLYQRTLAPTATQIKGEEAITALQSIISQDALDKMTENARAIGLDYEPARQDVPETNFGNMAEPGYAWPTIEQRAVIQQMVDALDHADELLGGNDTLVMNGAAAGRWLLEQPAVQESQDGELIRGHFEADYTLYYRHADLTWDHVLEIYKDERTRAAWYGWQCRTRNTTTPPAQPADQREWMETACALIKAADDAAADRDYMLDSDDCIAVLRGTWKAPLANDMPKQPTPPAPAVQEPVAQNNCIECANADSWGLPDKPFCRSCVSNSEWSPLNRSSVNPITPPAPQPVPVQDAEGENKAVRSFLMLYGQPGLTVGQMKKHMARSGFTSWPTWVDTEPYVAHLTKAGAQLWVRHLFALEPPAPQPVPVKTYHDGKPWPVAPKPWVGLTDEERNECTQSPFTADQHRAIEAKLKEKNHDQ
jgi:hypothetical protein